MAIASDQDDGTIDAVAAVRTAAEVVAWFNARYTIAVFDGWVASAQPGARIVYGRGVAASTCPPGVAERMRLLAQHEIVHLFQRRVVRDDAAGNALFPFDYIARRSTRPLPKGFPQLLTLDRPALSRRVVSPKETPALVADAARVSTRGRSWER